MISSDKFPDHVAMVARDHAEDRVFSQKDTASLAMLCGVWTVFHGCLLGNTGFPMLKGWWENTHPI